MKYLRSIIQFILFFFMAGQALVAANYYVAASGGSNAYDGTSCNTGHPWATFAYSMTRLTAGDTLWLCDGTYNQSLTVTISGTNGNPIIFKSVNDGQAIVDGQNVRIPFDMKGWEYPPSGLHDIQVEGIIFKNSSSSVLRVANSDRITIKKVSGYRAGDCNCHIFDFSTVTYSLIEDCIASGRSRVSYDILDSSHVTLRRNYMHLTEGVTPVEDAGTDIGIQIYGSSNSIVENNVITRDPTAYYAGDGSPRNMAALHVWTHTYNSPSNDNLIIGNVAIGGDPYDYDIASAQKIVHGNIFTNNVGINSTGDCFHQIADANLAVSRLMCVTASPYMYRAQTGVGSFDPGYAIGGTLKNSSFYSGGIGLYWTSADPYMGVLTNTYNNYYGLSANYGGSASSGTGEKTLNPSYPYSTYGNGAYLMVPSALQGQGEAAADIGASILYEYVDGSLTATHLWPWPMESRVTAELPGHSVTYESAGGIWKTITGIYSIPNKCDINVDGLTNSNDITALIDIILGRTTSAMGDINSDGNKNIMDLMTLVSVLLGRQVCP